MKAHQKHLMTCHLAGRQYYDADLVWDYLRVGKELILEREETNPHDAFAVKVGFEKDGEVYHIGYLPRGENELVSNLLEMGWDNVFRCVISSINTDVHPEKQIYLTISIRNRKDL